MYIYEDVAVQQAEETASKIAKLNEFLRLGPQQVNTLYNARLNNLLAEAQHNNLIHQEGGDAASRERRARQIQMRRRGACKKFELPDSGGETISCVVWDTSHYITGTDIIKIITYRLRLENISIPPSQQKKFEEGIFSDLRYLKAGRDARLEEARSEFLEWLCRHGAIRTQKKQKVYLWKAVNFEKLLVDARERLSKQMATSKNPLDPSGIEEREEIWDLPFEAEWKSTTPISSLLSDDPILDLTAGMETECDVYSTSASLLSEVDSISDEARSVAPSSLSLGELHANLLDATCGGAVGGEADLGWNLHLFEPSMVEEMASSLSLADKETFQIIDRYAPPTTLLEATNPANLFDLPAGGNGEIHSAMAFDHPHPYHHHSHAHPQHHPHHPPHHSHRPHHHSHHHHHHHAHLSRPHSTPLTPSPPSKPRILPCNPGSLARSERREEDRRYICTYQFCKRRFKRLEHLKRHLRIHTGERPFTCPIDSCRKSFSRSDNLAQHLKIHMPDALLPVTPVVTPSMSIIRPTESPML